ncbi:ABC transporter substrate-binding protein [[Eubacterium] cellulosolvens]
MSKKSEKDVSRRKFITIGAGAAIAAAVIGAGAYFNYKPREEEVKIGLLAPLTGEYSMFGEDMLRNAEFAIDKWNEKGGVLGKPITLLVRDDENKPEPATRRAKELINTNKVNFLSGPLSAACQFAVNEVIREEKIPWMIGAAVLPPLRMKDTRSDYAWWVMAAPKMYCSAAAKFALDNFGDSIYIMGSDYAWGRGCGESGHTKYEEFGGNIVGEDYVPLGSTDFSAYFPKIQAAKPDVIFGAIAGTMMISFIKQAHSFGILEDTPLMGTNNPTLTETMALSPEEMENVYTGLQFYWEYPNAKEYVDEFIKKYDIPPDTFGYNIYAGLNNLFTAIERVGTLEPKEINDEIARLGKWDWGKGESYYRACDHQAIQTWQIGKGKDPTKVEGEWDRFEIVHTYTTEEIGKFLTPCEELGYVKGEDY